MFINYIKDGELTMESSNQSNVVITTYGVEENMTSLTFNLNEVTTDLSDLESLANAWNEYGSNNLALEYNPFNSRYYIVYSDGKERNYLCYLPTCLTALISEGNCMEIYNSSITNIVVHGSMFLELIITIEFV